MLLSLAIAIPSSASAQLPTTRTAGTDHLAAAARGALLSMLDRTSLRLSSADAGDAGRFEFLLTIALPAKRGGGEQPVTHYLVAADKGSVAILILSPGGDPFAYVTGGFMASLDPAAPERLTVRRGGNPALEISADPTRGSLVTEVSFRASTRTPVVLLDVAAILKAAAARAERVSFDLGERRVRLTTENSDLVVTFSEAGQEATTPLRNLVVRGGDGAVVAVSQLRVNAERPSLTGLSKDAFEKLGLPTKTLEAANGSAAPLFVPPTFGRDEREHASVRRFREAFPALPQLPVVAAPTRPSRERF